MSVNDEQVGGKHYQKKIQPWAYIEANNLDFFEGNVLKYLTRWKEKDGVQDLYKAMHYLEKVIDRAKSGAYGGQHQELLEESNCTHCVNPAACEFNDRCQRGLKR